MTDPVTSAKIELTDNGTPIAVDFKDVYFSKTDGLEETNYVFLSQNNLKSRFNNLNSASAPQRFIIGETGFGSGLNFCATASLFQQLVKLPHQLTFISVEAYPLKKADLNQVLDQFPAIETIKNALISNYPPLCQGVHCLRIASNITLLLIFADAEIGFKSLLSTPDFPAFDNTETKIDAWFLDGFAPSKNSSLWHHDLFSLMARLSYKETTLSTFTAAGLVRRGLQQVGFRVKKTKGFGRKREMLSAQFEGLPCVSEPLPQKWKNPKSTAFWPLHQQHQAISSATIIGGGIAGVTTALRLSQAGFEVTILEQENQLLTAASGNQQAVLYPKFSAHSGALADFYTRAYWYALNFYHQEFPDAFYPTGLLQLLSKEKQLEEAKLLIDRYSQINSLRFATIKEACQISGLEVESPALFFPDSGWIAPNRIANKLNEQDKIQIEYDHQVNSIQFEKDHWVIDTDKKKIKSHAVILAAGHLTDQLLFNLDNNLCLQTKPIKGQVTSLSCHNLPKVKSVICHEGYICPPLKENLNVGASYDLTFTDDILEEKAQKNNLRKMKKAIKSFNQYDFDDYPLRGKIGFRCTTKDYLPIIGPVPKSDAFIEDFGDLRKNKNLCIAKKSDYWPNLFIHTGLGSKGFTSAPIGAEIIHAYLTNNFSPLPFEQIKSLHPGRFLIRAIIQNRFKN